MSGRWFVLFVGASACGLWTLCYLVGCYLLWLLIVCFGLIGSFGVLVVGLFCGWFVSALVWLLVSVSCLNLGAD